MEFTSKQFPPKDNPFDSPVPIPIPVQSHIEEKFDESKFSTSQIESMLELGRFFYRKGFNLKDRDSALRFVSKLISSDLIRQSTLDSLKADNRAEFERLLDRCVQSPSQRIINGILKILTANKIPIPSDVDSFILKLSMLSDFRDGICSKFNEKTRAKIFQLCDLLLKVERSLTNDSR